MSAWGIAFGSAWGDSWGAAGAASSDAVVAASAAAGGAFMRDGAGHKRRKKDRSVRPELEAAFASFEAPPSARPIAPAAPQRLAFDHAQRKRRRALAFLLLS